MITCYLRYQINPDKLADFEAYGAMWLDLMPRFGDVQKAVAFAKETRCFIRYERSFFRPLLPKMA